MAGWDYYCQENSEERSKGYEVGWPGFQLQLQDFPVSWLWASSSGPLVFLFSISKNQIQY